MENFKHTSLLLFLFVSLISSSFSQEESLDEGFSSIYVNAPIEDLSLNLTKAKATSIWHDITIEDAYSNITDRYLYNLDALETKSFFGLPIDRIEINSATCFDLNTGQLEGFIGVTQFYIFLKLPSDQEFKAFSDKIQEKYGPIEDYEYNPEDATETPRWSTYSTMLTFTNFENPFLSSEREKYLLVTYYPAYRLNTGTPR